MKPINKKKIEMIVCFCIFILGIVLIFCSVPLGRADGYSMYFKSTQPGLESYPLLVGINIAKYMTLGLVTSLISGYLTAMLYIK